MMKMLFVSCIFIVAARAAVPGSIAGIVDAVRGGRCRTLCESGLGGKPCGCPAKIVKTRLNTEMNAWRIAHPDEHIIKGPRRQLCKSLCPQGLGEPLCHCIHGESKESPIRYPKNWCPICRDILLHEKSPQLWLELECNDKELQSFCRNSSEHIILKRGADDEPPKDTNIKDDLLTAFENLEVAPKEDEEEVDWNLWCEIQCEENNGGLACNCDMLPLSLV